MSIPRLPEASTPYTTSVTVGTKLRPYFETWFNKLKLDGETPEEFIIRKLKERALEDYISFVNGEALTTLIAENSADAEVLKGEV